MDNDFDGQVICHCVSKDCSKCPVRNIGTSGVKAEIVLLKGNMERQENNDEE